MPSQYQQNNSQHDPLLDHLDEINEELDEIESSKNPKKSNRSKYVLLAILGAVAGLCIRASFTFLPSNLFEDTTYDDEGITLQQQPSGSIQEALRIYDLVYNGTYTVDSQQYRWDSTMQDFLNHGWSVNTEYGNPSNVGSNDVETVTLVKGDYEIHSFGLYNDEDYSVDIKKAPIDHIYCYDDEIDFEAPLGFRKGMSETEMKEILKNNSLPYEITKYSDTIYYSMDVGGADSEGNYKAVMMDITMRDEEVNAIYVYVYNSGNSQVISLG